MHKIGLASVATMVLSGAAFAGFGAGSADNFIDGGDAKVITEGEDPSWAPNSRTLVFARRTSKFGPRKLSLLDWPTGHVKDIAQVAGSSSQPSWSR